MTVEELRDIAIGLLETCNLTDVVINWDAHSHNYVMNCRWRGGESEYAGFSSSLSPYDRACKHIYRQAIATIHNNTGRSERSNEKFMCQTG